MRALGAWHSRAGDLFEQFGSTAKEGRSRAVVVKRECQASDRQVTGTDARRVGRRGEMVEWRC
jgi:hypothetical protein